MPMSHKNKKSKRSSKKPKLSTKTGWNIYSQHYLAEMQPETFTLFDKLDKEEQESGKDKEDNNTITSKNLKKIIKKLKIEVTKEISSDELYKKFHLSQILRTEAVVCGRMKIRRSGTIRPRRLTLKILKIGGMHTRMKRITSYYLRKTLSSRSRNMVLILRKPISRSSRSPNSFICWDVLDLQMRLASVLRLVIYVLRW